MFHIPYNRQILISYGAIFLGVSALIVGGGLSVTVTSIQLAQDGASSLVSGIVLMMYPLGAVVATLNMPKMVGRVGHIRVFGAFAGLASAALLLHNISHQPLFLAFLRFAEGVSITTAQVVVENWLIAIAVNRWRVKIVSIYLVVSYGSVSIAQAMLVFFDSGVDGMLLILSVMVSVAMIPLMLVRISTPQSGVGDSISGVSDDSDQQYTVWRIFKESPLAIILVFGGGVCQSSLMNMVPQYVLGLGWSIRYVGISMMVLTLGAVIGALLNSQFPAHIDRRIHATICLVIAALAAVVLALYPWYGEFMNMSDDTKKFAIILTIMLSGFSTIPIYAIGVAHASDRLNTIADPSVTASMVLTFVVGTVFGPVLAGMVISVTGSSGMWILNGSLMIGLLSYNIYRILVRDASNEDTSTPFVLSGGNIPTVGAAEIVSSVVDVPEVVNVPQDQDNKATP